MLAKYAEVVNAVKKGVLPVVVYNVWSFALLCCGAHFDITFIDDNLPIVGTRGVATTHRYSPCRLMHHRHQPTANMHVHIPYFTE